MERRLNPVTEYLALELGATTRKWDLEKLEWELEKEHLQDVIAGLFRDRALHVSTIVAQEARIEFLNGQLAQSRAAHAGTRQRLDNANECLVANRRQLAYYETRFARATPPAENRPYRRIPETLQRNVRARLEEGLATYWAEPETETEVEETDLEDN